MIGQTVSHYQILEKLGQGGMGVIYKAEDILLKRTVVLKFLPPDLTDDVEARERFIHEAQAASALDHPNICTIYEIGKTEQDQMFIAMAYYEGETLKELISRGPLVVQKAIEVTLQIATGLSTAHEHDIVHRDIKPANIIITSNGTVKILDFGLAKLKGRTKVTKTGSTLGTVAYMSPEQAKGDEVDHRTDIWSLGVVLYEMLTSRLPFQSDHSEAILFMILNEAPESLSFLRGDVSSNLEMVVKKCLAKNLEGRYQSAKEVFTDLTKQLDFRLHTTNAGVWRRRLSDIFAKAKKTFSGTVERPARRRGGLREAIVLDVCVLRPDQLLTPEECDVLAELMRQRMKDGYRLFVLDLENIYSLNSSSLGAIFTPGSKIQMRMGKLVFAGVNKQVRRALEVTQLIRLFDVHDTVQLAVADLLDLPVDHLPPIKYEE